MQMFSALVNIDIDIFNNHCYGNYKLNTIYYNNKSTTTINVPKIPNDDLSTH